MKDRAIKLFRVPSRYVHACEKVHPSCGKERGAPLPSVGLVFKTAGVYKKGDWIRVKLVFPWVEEGKKQKFECGNYVSVTGRVDRTEVVEGGLALLNVIFSPLSEDIGHMLALCIKK